MLIFSEQDAIKDPPFSKLDLISCRNLMIYMGGPLQKKIIPLFHYALNPGGFLFLGNSETTGDFNDLFEVIDRKMKIFQRKEIFHNQRGAGISHFPPQIPVRGNEIHLVDAKPASQMALPLREVTEQALLQHFAPAGALVDSKGDILYFHGRTGMYLEPASGEAGINNILKMAREGLKQNLTVALHAANPDQRDSPNFKYPSKIQWRIYLGQHDHPASTDCSIQGIKIASIPGNYARNS